MFFPLAAWADLTATVTLQSGTALNLDTGATSSSGGDILFTGNAVTSQISVQGNATIFNDSGVNYNTLTQAILSASLPAYGKNPLSSGALVVGEVFSVHTNGGNFAKVMVTAASTGSITLQYTTFGVSSSGGGGSGGSGAGAPSITQVQNNYSYILPGLPNYGIAPASLFIVQGANLNSLPLSGLQSSAAPGLPTTLSGTSISVSVNGVTTQPGLYYTSPTQLAAVLPSNTPVGTGTITVTNGTLTSAPAAIQVVQSALGFDALNGSGTGTVVATDSNGNVFGLTNSVSPGGSITLWGSGVGADTANSDKVYPLAQDNLTSIPMQVYVGGIQATILYRGRSQYPGVDQVDITIPPSVSPGCYVSVVAVSGSVVSNSVTIPVNPGGGTCSDPNLGTTGTTISSFGGKPTVHTGDLLIVESNVAGQPTVSIAEASFESQSGTEFNGSSSGTVSIGGCVIVPPSPTVTVEPAPDTPLDAGTITVTGPTGTQTLTKTTALVGGSIARLPAGFIPATGGSFTFNGSGGADVGSFSTTVNFLAPLTWTNMNAITTVSRTQGVTLTWTGGAAGTYVLISGSSSTSDDSLSVTFSCIAPVGPGQFTVSPAVLLALPAGSGGLFVENATPPKTFTASGLDFAASLAGAAFQISASYQ